MKNFILLFVILFPAILGLANLVVPSQAKKNKYLRETINVFLAGCLVYLVISLWGKAASLNLPWIEIAGHGEQIDFQLRWYGLSQFIVIAIAAFTFLGVLFSVKFTTDNAKSNQFYGYVFLSEAMAIGAVLANNLLIMMFFWEALLITLYLFISIGNPTAYKSAIKALIIAGLTDFCLMFGTGMVGLQMGTLEMTKIHLTTAGLGGVTFIFLLIGAIGKTGAMPFHTWMLNAADNAPMPFLVFIPTVINKLIGIYLAVRIVMDFFVLDQTMRLVVMTLGAISIVLAMFMAFIQTDIKRMLIYSGIGEAGYMILGVGTGNPIGIAGGLFYLINHVTYQTGLFYTGGAVEKQTGTTDLSKLGGLARQMPLTAGAFILCGAGLAGLPFLTSGFVSKAMVMEAAGSYKLFLFVTIVGAILSCATVLKLGHAVFFGKSTQETKTASEAHWTMLVPMAVVSLITVFFGLNFKLPLNLIIKPNLAAGIPHNFEFNPLSTMLLFTIVALLIAVFYHVFGVKSTGKGSGSAEHFRSLPGLKGIYNWADRGFFDPYLLGKKVGYYVAWGLFGIDRSIDWFFQKFIPSLAQFISSSRKIHNGIYANYLSWSLGGLIAMIIYLVWFVK